MNFGFLSPSQPNKERRIAKSPEDMTDTELAEYERVLAWQKDNRPDAKYDQELEHVRKVKQEREGPTMH